MFKNQRLCSKSTVFVINLIMLLLNGGVGGKEFLVVGRGKTSLFFKDLTEILSIVAKSYRLRGLKHFTVRLFQHLLRFSIVADVIITKPFIHLFKQFAQIINVRRASLGHLF